MQVLLAQSELFVQVFLSAHLEQAPPQSRSDSVPFLMPSSQEAMHFPPTHFSLTQSMLTKHDSESAQAGQKPPPQSLSVSVPLFTLSL